MKILWIPHTSWNNSRSRDQYFIEEMKKNHEIHVLTWTQTNSSNIFGFIKPKQHINGFQTWNKKIGEVYLHHYARFQTTSFTPYLLKRNEKRYQKKIREIVKNYNIDIIICGPSYYLNGFPPFDIGIPIIFDYVDFLYDEKIRNRYLTNSNCTLCVSKELLKQVEKICSCTYYLPNGIRTDRFKSTNPKRIRDKYKFGDDLIISLIGITCSESLYFIQSFKMMLKKIPNVRFLLVGDSPLLPRIRKASKAYKSQISMPGWINPNEIFDYFSVTDIGIYPVDDNIYYNSACPIKILEYSAAKKPIVSVELKEITNLNLTNIIYSKDNATDFADALVKCVDFKPVYSDISRYDIKQLKIELENILKGV